MGKYFFQELISFPQQFVNKIVGKHYLLTWNNLALRDCQIFMNIVKIFWLISWPFWGTMHNEYLIELSGLRYLHHTIKVYTEWI